MASLDELWAWLYEPLRELADHHRSNTEAEVAELPASFLDRLGLGSAADHPVVEELSRRLADLPEDERRQLLSDEGRLTTLGYEIATLHADETATGTAATDEDWLAFLAENGPHWNGQDDSWPQFRDWFAFHANERGLTTWAEGFLAAAEDGDKHAVFATYGVQVPTAATADDPAALATQLDADVVTPLVAQLRQESPQLAGLDDEQLRAMVIDSLSQEIGRRAAAGQGR